MELIALPLYNQAHITPKRIAELQTFVSGVDDVLIIDDGSDDNLGDLIKTGDKLKYARHEQPLGYGGTFVTALDYARKHDIEHILFLDLTSSEFTNPIATMRELLASGADFVNISRSKRNSKKDYITFNPEMQISQKLNSITGLDLHDVFSPFKAFKLDSIKEMVLEEFDESLILQLWIQAAHFKKKVREIYLADVAVDVLTDAALLHHEFEHYLNFIQGEILLYPQE